MNLITINGESLGIIGKPDITFRPLVEPIKRMTEGFERLTISVETVATDTRGMWLLFLAAFHSSIFGNYYSDTDSFACGFDGNFALLVSRHLTRRLRAQIRRKFPVAGIEIVATKNDGTKFVTGY